MTPDSSYLALAIACAALITFALRALPFVVKKSIRHSPLLHDLNAWMPLGVMLILVLYCLRNIADHPWALALPELVGAAITVVVHLWRRHILLSILCGTLGCILLANWR